ncbi:hypothetical protein Csa_009519, partial [Cucumis sativus]
PPLQPLRLQPSAAISVCEASRTRHLAAVVQICVAVPSKSSPPLVFRSHSLLKPKPAVAASLTLRDLVRPRRASSVTLPNYSPSRVATVKHPKPFCLCLQNVAA